MGPCAPARRPRARLLDSKTLVRPGWLRAAWIALNGHGTLDVGRWTRFMSDQRARTGTDHHCITGWRFEKAYVRGPGFSMQYSAFNIQGAGARTQDSGFRAAVDTAESCAHEYDGHSPTRAREARRGPCNTYIHTHPAAAPCCLLRAGGPRGPSRP